MFANIKNSIDKSLRKDVFDAVKEVELKHINSDVLGVYDPFVYQRRTSGGINDESKLLVVN